MEDNLNFRSPLASTMVRHMQWCKTSLAEHSYSIRLHHLLDFDHYLLSISYQEGKPIDESLVTGWIITHSHLKSSSIMSYTNSIRQFLRFYSALTGIYVYEPPLHQVDDSYAPYIYSDEEMNLIYELVDNYRSKKSNTLPFITLEFPMVIRLLDANGFRLNELITIKMSEVDLDNGIFRMLNSKNGRHRLVPLDDSMTDLLKIYCKKMRLEENSPAYLFPRHNRTEPLKMDDIESRFKFVLIKAGIRKYKSSVAHEREACIHCLRHRFTLRSIKQLLSLGYSLDDALPYLSVYLGHESIVETELYMKFFADAFPEEMVKFEKEAVKLLPEENIWNDWM